MSDAQEREYEDNHDDFADVKAVTQRTARGVVNRLQEEVSPRTTEKVKEGGYVVDHIVTFLLQGLGMGNDLEVNHGRRSATQNPKR